MVSQKKGFTLLEILLVVAALAILAGIVIVALNPTKQLGDTRNAQRRSDVREVLNAVYQNFIDTGSIPAAIDSIATSSQVLGVNGVSGCDTVCTATITQAACVDLNSALVPTYVVGIPMDPRTGTASITDYYINKELSGRITVGACDAEEGEVISVSR